MAEGGEKREGRGFVVQDRRRFSETGEPREGTGDTDSSSASETAESKSGTGRPAQPRGEPFAEINFSAFVISLSTQALMHLGEIPNPLDGKVETDISMAKQMIDILGMLRDKTRGNLSDGEERLLEDVLYDLRMKYVEAVKRK
ncbi:MAG TPA: DUF1844 domain-containing protein [candidate division Zixibacteria bacterium]|nr:DUF1844 domain-containing protein [candidate division Zixibacteria bacterium]